MGIDRFGRGLWEILLECRGLRHCVVVWWFIERRLVTDSVAIRSFFKCYVYITLQKYNFKISEILD